MVPPTVKPRRPRDADTPRTVNFRNLSNKDKNSLRLLSARTKKFSKFSSRKKNDLLKHKDIGELLEACESSTFDRVIALLKRENKGSCKTGKKECANRREGRAEVESGEDADGGKAEVESNENADGGKAEVESNENANGGKAEVESNENANGGKAEVERSENANGGKAKIESSENAGKGLSGENSELDTNFIINSVMALCQGGSADTFLNAVAQKVSERQTNCASKSGEEKCGNAKVDVKPDSSKYVAVGDRAKSERRKRIMFSSRRSAHLASEVCVRQTPSLYSLNGSIPMDIRLQSLRNNEHYGHSTPASSSYGSVCGGISAGLPSASDFSNSQCIRRGNF